MRMQRSAVEDAHTAHGASGHRDVGVAPVRRAKALSRSWQVDEHHDVVLAGEHLCGVEARPWRDVEVGCAVGERAWDHHHHARITPQECARSEHHLGVDHTLDSRHVDALTEEAVGRGQTLGRDGHFWGCCACEEE